MNSRNRSLLISSAVAGLVCGVALTQQQVKAATEDPATSSEKVVEVQASGSKTETDANGNNSNGINDTDASSSNSNSESAENSSTNESTEVDKNGINTQSTEAKQQVSTKAGQGSEVIDQGTWGTSKWEYTREGNDYVLHLHEGTLGSTGVYFDEKNYLVNVGVLQLNENFRNQLTKINIDPGVIANQDSDGLFYGLTKLTSIEGLENLDTSKVHSMFSMFEDCSSLTKIDLSHFNTSRVNQYSEMFRGCTNLINIDLSNFSTLPELGGPSTIDMFDNCVSLTDLKLGSLISGDAFEMFANCTSLTSLDLSKFIMPTGMTTDMFKNCSKLNHLIIGPNYTSLINTNLPIPPVGTVIPGTNKKVAAPYWVATDGYQKGQLYTSEELVSLEGRDQVTIYDWVSTDQTAKESTENKAVTRLISIHLPNGGLQNVPQSAIISRKVYTYEDGSVDYGDWTTAQWDAYEVPAFSGYEPSSKEIPAQAVTGTTVDQTVDIYYTPAKQVVTIQYLDKGKIVGTQQVSGEIGEKIKPNYEVPDGYVAVCPPSTITVNKSGNQIVKVNVKHQLVQTSELKTLTRTINLHLPNNSDQVYNQIATITRLVTEDKVTGQKTYGAWKTAKWDRFEVPKFAGYTATSAVIAAKTVTSTSKNEVVDIYYTANK